jgi:predicted permease
MLAGLIARARSLFRGVRGGASLTAEMRAEFRAHLELRAADLMKAGASREEAMRQARLEFGSLDHYVDRGRESRGLKPVDDLRISTLDFKLGARMLAKYPGLTIVGGLAIAFAITVGTATFEFIKQISAPSLGLPDGDRFVAVQLWDAAAGKIERRVAYDFVNWRDQAKSIELLGTYLTYERNLIAGTGQGDPVPVAEISASAFRLTGVRPLLGRPLTDADERPDAPPVAVIGFDVWQSRFSSDSGVVGRVVRLGSAPTTIVGVMPKGYAFPISQDLWIPLHMNLERYRPREGPTFAQVFGRLAPGVTFDQARAEVASITSRGAMHAPADAQLRPMVMFFPRSVLDLSLAEGAVLWSTNVFLVMLLVLVFANVALLMFARAASREGEMIVRTALGASRSRIITQLFAEALVLSGVGAVIGVGVASKALSWGLSVVEAEQGRRLPFWIHAGLSPTTLAYAIALTLLAAAVAGIVPALKVTSGGVDARLRRLAAGRGGLKFGGVWTAVIIAQVAVTVAFPATAFFLRREIDQQVGLRVGVADKEYLTAALALDRGSTDTANAAFAARFARTYDDFARRLLGEAAVDGVTLADRLPRMYHPARLIELDAGGAAPLDPQWPGHRVSSASVLPNFFGVLGARPRVGRDFRADDATSDHRVVIVNESFAHRVLGDRNPIGRRLRYTQMEERDLTQPTEWYEIVGVVKDMGASTDEDPKVSTIYHPATPQSLVGAKLAIHVQGDPAAFGPRLRAVAAATDPALRVSKIIPLNDADAGERTFLEFWFKLLLSMSAIALTLSLAGIYSVMAFTVSRRTREIGVRLALGADARRVLLSVFGRPIRQVAIGIAVGGVLAFALLNMSRTEWLSPVQVALFLGYACLMMLVCLLACAVPTHRALRIEPTEALKSE